MKFNKIALLISVVAFVYSCSSTGKTTSRTIKKVDNSPEVITYQQSDEKYLFTKEPGNFYFNILQLNDVYEIAPVHEGKYGGMARVETIRKALLEENPYTFSVLAGDFLNPSLLGTLMIDGTRVEGRQMVEVMNAMNFDLVAFGNHEFDISYDQLQERLNESNFEWISSNVLHNQNGQAHYFQKIKNGRKIAINDTYVQEIYSGNGDVIKVGFISACIASNPVDYVTYGDVFIETERSYNEIKGRADVVLGLTHLSIDQDVQLAEMLPNIPLIMGGHEHTNHYKTVGNVKIAKADANAKTVYIHRFEYNPITQKTNVKSELRTVDAKIPEDARIATLVNKWQNILKNKIKDVIANPDEIVYHATTPLEGRDKLIRSQQTNMGAIITEAMSFSFNNEVDCSLLNGGSIRIDDILTGNINAVDVFRMLPYGGEVLKVEMKGSLLNEVLEYSEKAIGTGAYLQKNNISNKNGTWFIKDSMLDLNKTYIVATSDYLMKGFDIPFLKESNSEVSNVTRPVETDLSFDVRNALASYLKTK